MANFNVPYITEKRYTAISPVPLTINGTTSGLITISSTYRIKVGQILTFRSNSSAIRLAKVKRVISSTQFIVIEPKDSVVTSNKLDMSMFTVADTATVELSEDKRPVIDLLEIQRQVYEEEPTIALRSHMVDWLGRSYDKSNPVPVEITDGSISIGTVNAELEVQLSHKDNYPNSGDVADSVRIGDGIDELAVNPDGSINVELILATTPTIVNLNVVAADTEYSYALPVGTKHFTIKDRKGDAKIRMAYVSGESGVNFKTIDMGNTYEAKDISTIAGLTIYFQSSKASRIIEIESWK